MKNVGFDNPYLLLLLIPLAIILLIPTIIALIKGIKNKAIVISFCIHILIAVVAVLALAGLKTETVITETEIYVVADVSYSSNANLDKIDGYIKQIEEKAPKNTEIGIICFGKNYEKLTDLGDDIVSVKKSRVDTSATNISDALNYAADQFSEDAIKRVVLITDGKETASTANGQLISAIENLYAKDIYIDTIYVDSNLSDNSKEVQISDVEYTNSTYLNHDTTANIAIQSTYDVKTIVHLYKDGVLYESEVVQLNKGYNIVNLALYNEESGTYDYRVEIATDEIIDESQHNNQYSFTQRVAGEVSVLLVTDLQSDLDKARELYGEDAEITACGNVNGEPLPCDIEELCKYDEIIISSTDISTLENYGAFVRSVDVAVSSFGKTLITMGDLKLQNTTDETLKQLENILPVNFGNNGEDPKLYTIVIDVSRSMQDASQLILAKMASIQLMSLLSDEDYVCVVAFSGSAKVIQAPTKASNRENIAKIINDIKPSQGTFLGAALDETFKTIGLLPYADKQVMLISDGRSYTLEADNPIKVAKQMKDSGIIVSTINVNSPEGEALLRQIASAGGGIPYYPKNEKELEAIMFGEIADKVTVSVVEENSTINVQRPKDELLEGIYNIPSIDGYVFSSIKSSATTVLVTEHKKSSGEITTPPIYAYWSYGEGRVCTFTSTFSGKWIKNWEDNDGEKLLQRLLDVNTPDEKVEFPYTINVEYDGVESVIELIPAVLNPYATVKATITMPNGEKLEISSNDSFAFDSSKYVYSFETPHLGKYAIDIEYGYDEKSFNASTTFNISYSPEYDRFVVFSPSPLHAAVRDRGTVNYESVPSLENNEDEIETYILRFTIPLLIIAVILFVVDVMVRKLKWNDIKGLFKRQSKGGNVK